MRDTSIEAYHSIKHPQTKRQQVFNVIKEYGPMTDQEVADRLGWTINRVTGRRNELVDEGYVRMIGTKQNKFNRRVYVWGCCISFKQLSLL